MSFWRKLLGKKEHAPSKAGLSMNVIYDRQTAEVMAKVLERGSCCVDVGCHEGSILDQVLRHAPAGEHYAFEPLPHLFEFLQRKYAGVKNVHLYDLALSDSFGETTFHHVVTNPSYSGIRQRRFDRPNEEVSQIKVRLARLDDILPATVNLRLLKIDVEGAELNVLRGAEATLKRWRPFVIFEHGQGSAEFYGTRPEHVHDFLGSCGLRVSLLEDFLASGGKKVLSREAFVREFDLVTNYYFIAHP